MARRPKNTVDYFPHPVSHGKKMSYLEKKYKNDGYATWFKILEELGKAENHYLNLSDEVQMMFLSDRCLVDEELLISIIEDLIRLREFDKDLWNENRILFNEKFNESIDDAYKKRTNEIISKNSLLLLLDSLGIRKLPKSKNKPLKSTLQVGKKPQTILEYTILEETKLKKTREKSAHELLISDKKIEYESFVMQNKSSVKNWDDLVSSFNDQMDIEIHQNKIQFEAEQLMPRFRKWTRSWISNQNHQTFKKSNNEVQQAIKRKLY